jgi:hypothetical protein
MSCCLADANLLCDFLVGPSNGDASLIVDFGRHVLNCEGARACGKRNLFNSATEKCPVKNPLFLPETKAVGQVVSTF